MTIADEIFSARWIANGFPKSGTHLLAHSLSAIARYQEPASSGLFEQPWAGTFSDNSWTNVRQPIEITCFRIGRVGNGRLIKAHLGYDPQVAKFIRLGGNIHVFIYRNLRDVAVSQAFHILNSSSESLSHPNPEVYDLENFDNLLLQVIRGHDRFPSLHERWELYKDWLDDDWTIKVCYDEFVRDLKGTCKFIFVEAMQRMADRFRTKIKLDPEGLDAVTTVMAKVGGNTDASPTFRRGKSGGWKDYFKREHERAFEEAEDSFG